MSTATHTFRHVHVPATWIVWLIALLAVILIVASDVVGWQATRSTAHPVRVAPRASPAPAPEPMVGEPYPGRAGVLGRVA